MHEGSARPEQVVAVLELDPDRRRRLTVFTRRKPRAADGAAPRSLIERVLFSFMGPPQLGANRAPEGFAPDPQADLCHKCGQPWAAHARVQTSNMTYTTCPSPA